MFADGVELPAFSEKRPIIVTTFNNSICDSASPKSLRT